MKRPNDLVRFCVLVQYKPDNKGPPNLEALCIRLKRPIEIIYLLLTHPEHDSGL